MGKLDEKVAMVTGGARGMGFGSSRAMAQYGAKVIIVGNSETAWAAIDTFIKEGYGA